MYIFIKKRSFQMFCCILFDGTLNGFEKPTNLFHLSDNIIRSRWTNHAKEKKRTITSQFSKRPPLESIYSPSFHNKFNCSLHRSIIYMPHLCNTGLFLIMWWEKRFKLKFNHFILDIGWWSGYVEEWYVLKLANIL